MFKKSTMILTFLFLALHGTLSSPVPDSLTSNDNNDINFSSEIFARAVQDEYPQEQENSRSGIPGNEFENSNVVNNARDPAELNEQNEQIRGDNQPTTNSNIQLNLKSSTEDKTAKDSPRKRSPESFDTTSSVQPSPRESNGEITNPQVNDVSHSDQINSGNSPTEGFHPGDLNTSGDQGLSKIWPNKDEPQVNYDPHKDQTTSESFPTQGSTQGNFQPQPSRDTTQINENPSIDQTNSGTTTPNPVNSQDGNKPHGDK
ncbi:expressed protein [Phakopsora pachyrhizi]|uniref:Expressed protein n=1 Tax=Phakopsora pachyrhizi TaxID=170000 RepID=A0AAV0AYG9_PHAPC|nr:expressed protein [Phakopsora pachyrhizi]